MKKTIYSFLTLATVAAPAFAAGRSVLGDDAVLTGSTRATLNTGSATDAYAQFVADAGAKSAVLDWSKFNIGAGKEMNFSGAGTTFFNLVDGEASKSQINGIISGNGSVWVINPSGVAFGANSQVNVGGTFAAAAGNLSNAEQLRKGTAMTPEFSSFAGEVSSVSGSKFTADQVALLGKTVSAAGDMSAVKSLNVGVADKLLIDTVEGGRVQISISEGVLGSPDITASLGDLNVGGDLIVDVEKSAFVGQEVSANDISLNTGGNAYVVSLSGDTVKAKTNGGDIYLMDVTASEGNVEIESARGSVIVAEGGSVKTTGKGGDVILKSSTEECYLEEDLLYFTDGDVVVNGVVSAEGEGGDVVIGAKGSIYALPDGTLAANTGDVVVNGTVTANKNVEIAAGIGSVEVNGTLAGDSLVEVATGLGDITFGAQSKVESGRLETESSPEVSGAISVLAGTIAEYGSGDVNVQSEIDPQSSTLHRATMTVQGADGKMQVCAGFASGASGSVTVDGRIEVKGQNGEVRVSAGYGGGLGSKGDLTVNGEVEVGHEVTLEVYNGSLNIGEGASVLQSGGNSGFVDLKACQSENSAGDINVAGSVKSTGNTLYDEDGNLLYKSGVSILSGNGKGSSGNITLSKGGTIETTGKNALVQIASGINDATAEEVEQLIAEEKELRGDVSIQGTVSLSGDHSQAFVWGGYGNYTKGNVSVAGEIVNTGNYGEVKVWSGRGEHAQGDLTVDGTITSSGIGSLAYLFASYGDYSKGNLYMRGTMTAPGGLGTVEATAARGNWSSGNVEMSGSMNAFQRAYIGVAAGRESQGDLTLSGQLCSGGYMSEDGQLQLYGAAESDTLVVCGLGQKSQSSGRITGSAVSLAPEGVMVFDGGRGVDATSSLTIDATGEVVGRDQVQVMSWNGNVTVNGQVASWAGKSCDATVEALSDDGKSGNVYFGVAGKVDSEGSANVVASGDVRQEGTRIVIRDGFAEEKSLHAAISGDSVNVRVYGDVGEGASAGLSVSGNLRAIVDGNASFSAANGQDFHGGGTGAPNIANIEESVIRADETINKLSVSDVERNGDADSDVKVENLIRDTSVVKSISQEFDNMGSGIVMAKGDLAFYTKGKLRSNGFFSAGGNLTVSASTFGDMSYLQAGGLLTINNVGKPLWPQIAYFESVNGVEPLINNQPNDTVIFVDGRLAGGNLKILNQFGANEAFLVQTPELKSTQGIFGNPTFLHSDLDVANPMEVSAIDYMLQETPRLTLDKSFPPEVDSHVDSVVVPEKDSIQFGRNVRDESPAASEEKVAETASADGKVAMAR